MDTVILNALPQPVVLVGRNREVTAANPAAEELFGAIRYDQDLSITTRHPDILQAVEQTLNGEDVDVLEVSFTHPISRTYELSVTQIVSSVVIDGHQSQALLLFHDITPTRQAEKFRTDFIANVSHELRSPLVSLIGFIETLQTTARDDPDAQSHFLTIMEAEAGRMKSLIDDLLSLSKIEANEHVRPSDPVQILNVIQLVMKPLGKKAEDRQITLTCDCQPDLPPVLGDLDELIQVFNNLVDNAIKYGRSGSPVTITIKEVPRIPSIGVPGLQVSVHNEGEAIPPEHLPRLTERFYRIDKGRSRAVGGTGLGLAIVKHMVNRHRGRMTIASTPAEGTTFSVFLPIESGAT